MATTADLQRQVDELKETRQVQCSMAVFEFGVVVCLFLFLFLQFLVDFILKTERALEKAKHKFEFERIAQWMRWLLANSRSWEETGVFERFKYSDTPPESEPSSSGEAAEEDSASEAEEEVKVPCKRRRYIVDSASDSEAGDLDTEFGSEADDEAPPSDAVFETPCQEEETPSAVKKSLAAPPRGRKRRSKQQACRQS